MMFMHAQLIGKMMCIFNWCWSLLIEMYTIPIHTSMDSGRLHHYVLKIPREHESPAGTVFITSSNFGLKGVQGVLIELEWPVLSFECSGCFWIPWLSPTKTTANTISKPLWHSTSRFRGLTVSLVWKTEVLQSLESHPERRSAPGEAVWPGQGRNGGDGMFGWSRLNHQHLCVGSLVLQHFPGAY